MADDLKRVVAWKSLLINGTDYCALWHTGEGWLLKGTVVGLLEDHRPLLATYEVNCDEKWRTNKVQVERTIGGDVKSLSLIVETRRIWRSSTEELRDIHGCDDVDLALTPATNTLPIRRLNLPVGGTESVVAAWVLSELKQPEYELVLLVATCGLRISEALGLRWRNILWDRGLIAIRETFVHFNMQEGAKTKLSRSRVEAPQLLLDALAAWRQKATYAEDDDFVFPSEKLNGEQPRSASQLVEDYVRPASIAAGVIRVENGVTYDRDGEIVKRFGFHNLGRHSLATFLMDEQENPAVVQAIMRHAKMDMTLYYSHSRRKAKRAAQEKVLQRLLPEEMRVPMREPETIQ
jgi:hypothetical protein